MTARLQEGSEDKAKYDWFPNWETHRTTPQGRRYLVLKNLNLCRDPLFAEDKGADILQSLVLVHFYLVLAGQNTNCLESELPWD